MIIKTYHKTVELRQLKYFVAIAEELHYNHAAEKLFVSQPALSQQIQLLENEIGVELFVKIKRKKLNVKSRRGEKVIDVPDEIFPSLWKKRMKSARETLYNVYKD